MDFPDTTSQPETVEFNGVTYRLMGGKRRYYLSQARRNAGRKGAKGLHVAIWEYVHGREVPAGHDIHHVDEDPFNNAPDNLAARTRSQHQRLHMSSERLRNARQHLAANRDRAAEWHRSPEGRAWHREHAKRVAAHQKPSETMCIECGATFQAINAKVAKYCCRSCETRHRAKHDRITVTAECVVCGQSFTYSRQRVTSNKWRQTCSRSCASILSNRHGAGVQPRR